MHRSDGSGSTFNFTEFLAAASPEWKAKYGADTLISWPLGSAAKGGSGVVDKLRRTRGAIGYVEYGQAVRASLAYAALQNPAGQFVVPTPETFQQAAAGADWVNAKDFHLSLVNAPGDGSYPLTVATFALMHHKGHPEARTLDVLHLFRFALDDGRGEAERLGYVPLPETLVKQVKSYWAGKFGFGS